MFLFIWRQYKNLVGLLKRHSSRQAGCCGNMFFESGTSAVCEYVRVFACVIIHEQNNTVSAQLQLPRRGTSPNSNHVRVERRPQHTCYQKTRHVRLWQDYTRQIPCQDLAPSKTHAGLRIADGGLRLTCETELKANQVWRPSDACAQVGRDWQKKFISGSNNQCHKRTDLFPLLKNSHWHWQGGGGGAECEITHGEYKRY